MGCAKLQAAAAGTQPAKTNESFCRWWLPLHPPPTTNQRHADPSTQKINNKTHLNILPPKQPHHHTQHKTKIHIHQLINQFLSCLSKTTQKRVQSIKLVEKKEFAPNI